MDKRSFLASSRASAAATKGRTSSAPRHTSSRQARALASRQSEERERRQQGNIPPRSSSLLLGSNSTEAKSSHVERATSSPSEAWHFLSVAALPNQQADTAASMSLWEPPLTASAQISGASR